MSVIERDVVLIGKDEDGNECIDLPITRLGNIEDTADTKEALADNDHIPLVDSADNGKMKKIPWSAFKNKLSAKEGSVTTAGTGAAYTAAVDGITELKAGLHIRIVPHTVSTSTTPTLNVNGLGAKGIRRRLSSSAASLQGGYAASWLASGKPFTLTYDGTYWVVEGLTKPDAADLSGPVPVSKGGTGKTSWTVNRLIYPSAATTLAQLAFPSVAGSVLRQGTSGAPYWTSLTDLATALGVSGGAKIATGSYNGTGTYGVDDPCSLTFDFVPKIVFIMAGEAFASTNENDKSGFAFIACYINGHSTMWDITTNPCRSSNQQPEFLNTVSAEGNSISWYCGSEYEGARGQLNLAGFPYRYFAIG